MLAGLVWPLATDTGNKGNTGKGNATARPLHSTLPRFGARIRAEADSATQSHCGVWNCTSQHLAASFVANYPGWKLNLNPSVACFIAKKRTRCSKLSCRLVTGKAPEVGLFLPGFAPVGTDKNKTARSSVSLKTAIGFFFGRPTLGSEMAAGGHNFQMACFAPNGGVSRPSKYGRGVPWLFTGPKRPTHANPLLSSQVMATAGVAGGRRWRASLAGVAGGRRRRSRTKIAVISTKGTKTRHTHKPRKKTAVVPGQFSSLRGRETA